MDGADGKAVDKSLTPELVNTSKQATILLCQHFLSKAEWTLGKNKIFMKDGCLDKIMKQFRTYHTTRIQSWWRMVKILRKYKRYRRAVKRMQRGWRAILLQRRYAAVASKITRLQAHIRRRIQQRRWKRIKAARANAGAIVKSYIRGNYDRKRYRKLTIGFQALQQKYRTYRYHKKFMKIRKYIRIIQSYVKMYLARKRYLRIRYVQANGCKLIQAKWRGYKNRKDYKLTRKSAITFQRRWRYRTAVLLRRKLFAIVVKLQSMCKAWKIRSKYRIMKRRATQIQAWWRMLLVSKAYRKQKRAVRIIEQAILQVINRRSLTKWVQDLHAAANWGDSKELEIILLCRRPEHYRIGQTIPNVGDRVKIRNRYDGFKSILHAAAAGGDVNAVKFLISRGAEPGTLDSFGATPLHKAASMGDSHLPVLQLLASLFTNPKAVLNHPNMAGETVIDTAIFSARNSGYGRREHDTTIKFLLDGGSEPTVCGLSSGQVMNMVNAPKPGAMAAAAAAARERELLERRAKERREDPHYQLLFVSEAERKRKAEAVASKGYINEATGERHRQEVEQHELKKQSSIRNVLQELGSDDITISTATVTNKTLTSSVVQAYVTPNSNTTQLSPTSMKKSLAEQYAEASLQDQSRKEQANTLKNEKITNARLIASQAYALQSNALDQQPVRPPVLGSPNVNTNNKTITIFNASPTSSSTAPSSSLLSETVNKSQTSKALLSNPSFSTASFTPTTSNANAYTNNDNKDPATFVASSLSSLIATGEKGRHPNRNVLGTHGTTPSQPTILPSVDISTLSSVSSPYNTNGTKPTVNTTFSPAISSPTNSDTYFSPVHTYLGSPDNKLEVASSNGSMNKSISILPTTTSLTNVPFVNANSNNVVSRPISLLNSTNSNRAISPVRPTSLAELDSIPPPRSIHQHSIIPSQSVTSPSSTGLTTSRSTTTNINVTTNPPPTAPIRAAMWTVHQSSSTGLLYYYNTKTGVTQWTEPSDFDGTYTPLQLELLVAVQAGPNSKATAAAITSASASGKVSDALASLKKTSGLDTLNDKNNLRTSPNNNTNDNSYMNMFVNRVTSEQAQNMNSSNSNNHRILSSNNIGFGGRPGHPAPGPVNDVFTNSTPLLPPVSTLAATLIPTQSSAVPTIVSNTNGKPGYERNRSKSPTLSRSVIATGPSSLLRQAVPPLSLVTGISSSNKDNVQINNSVSLPSTTVSNSKPSILPSSGQLYASLLESVSSTLTTNTSPSVTNTVPTKQTSPHTSNTTVPVSAIVSNPAPTTSNTTTNNNNNNGRKILHSGKNGWTAAMDSKQRTYYFHKSGKVQWDRPSDF